MKIGIIGTGMIASSVVTGFCTQKTGHEFFLSPRSASKAKALAEKFSEATVCASNQEVVDNADWVFISLHKKDFDAINEIKFRKDHKVCNMSAEMRLPDLKNRIGETALLAHVIPLPMIVTGQGPILVYPEVREVGGLFEKVGDVYYANDPSDVHTLQIVTGMMSAYYMLMDEFVKFSDDQGITHDVSVKFLHSMLSAMSARAAAIENCDLIELAHDMTPGGYNEQAMTELMENGAIKAWRTALDRLLARLKGSKIE